MFNYTQNNLYALNINQFTVFQLDFEIKISSGQFEK
jgi:hypothetical protein